MFKAIYDLLKTVEKNKKTQGEGISASFQSEEPTFRPSYAHPMEIRCRKCNTYIEPELKDNCRYCGNNEAR